MCSFSFPVSGPHPGHHGTFNYHVSLGSLGSDSFSDCAFFFSDLDHLRNTGQVLCRLICWDWADIFLVIRLGLCIWGRKTTEKYYVHHILLSTFINTTVTEVVDSITWGCVCLPSPLCVQLYFSDLGAMLHILGFPCSSVGKESACNAGD